MNTIKLWLCLSSKALTRYIQFMCMYAFQIFMGGIPPIATVKERIGKTDFYSLMRRLKYSNTNKSYFHM